MCVKKKEERLKALAEDKTVAIVKPPSQNKLDPMEKAKEILFHEPLSYISEILSLETFSKGGGCHSTLKQIGDILRCIDRKVREDKGVSIFLKSAENKLMTTKREYKGVRSLY